MTITLDTPLDQFQSPADPGQTRMLCGHSPDAYFPS